LSDRDDLVSDEICRSTDSRDLSIDWPVIDGVVVADEVFTKLVDDDRVVGVDVAVDEDVCGDETT
jgi:hypothetical protein